MSRSYREPIYVCSKQIDKKFDHKRVRTKVKAELKKVLEADELIIEADTRELGLEEWGTQFGVPALDDIGDPERIEAYRLETERAKRK